MLDVSGTTQWLRLTAARLKEQELFITGLDAAIGDGDHGINMAKGFGAVHDKVLSQPAADIGDLLKKTGMTLISTVGGASGPLYGTAFMRAGAALAGKAEAGLADLVAALEAAIAGIKQRGKAERGEKTMLDALEPAYDALKAGLEAGQPAARALAGAVAAARAGVEFTKTIRATKGRASYLGDRSIGHQDPGATSSTLMLECLHDFVSGGGANGGTGPGLA